MSERDEELEGAFDTLSSLCADEIAGRKSSIFAMLPWERNAIEAHEATVCEAIRVIKTRYRELVIENGALKRENARLVDGDEEIDLGDAIDEVSPVPDSALDDVELAPPESVSTDITPAEPPPDKAEDCAHCEAAAEAAKESE